MPIHSSFGDFAIDARTQLTLLHRRQGAPGLAVLTLRQRLSQEQLKPLLHLPSSLIGEGHRQNLRRICTVLPNQVGNAMGESPGLATTGAGNHQQRTFVVIHSPALGVVKSRQKAHAKKKNTTHFKGDEADEQMKSKSVQKNPLDKCRKSHIEACTKIAIRHNKARTI